MSGHPKEGSRENQRETLISSLPGTGEPIPKPCRAAVELNNRTVTRTKTAFSARQMTNPQVICFAPTVNRAPADGPKAALRAAARPKTVHKMDQDEAAAT